MIEKSTRFDASPVNKPDLHDRKRGRKRKIARRKLLPVDVLSRTSYIDSVFIVLPRLMERQQFRDLRLSLLGERRRAGQRYVLKKRKRPNGSWFFVMALHQPTKKSLELLDDALKSPLQARILEVHVALDLTTETSSDAFLLQRYVEERLLPSGRSIVPTYKVSTTTYYNRLTRKGVELALYSDRRGKAVRLPCLHIEWRTIGAQTLRSSGLLDPIDLIELDHNVFWRRRLSMWTPPSGRELVLARTRMRQDNLETAIDVENLRADACELLGSVMGGNGAVVAHDLLIALYKDSRYHERPRRLFRKEPIEWAVPESDNALWRRAQRMNADT